MRSTLFLPAFALAAILSGTSGPAMAEEVLAPATDWSQRSFDDKCRLSRNFGEGENRATLWIEQGGIVPAYNITLIGRPFRNPYGTNLSVQFAPLAEYSRDFIAAESSRGRPVISLFGARLVPTAAERGDDEGDYSDEGTEPEEVDLVTWASSGDTLQTPHVSEAVTDSVTGIRLGRALAETVMLETGSLTEPLAGLQACAEEVAAQIEENTRLASSPATPTRIEYWAKKIQENYPASMLRQEEEARLGIRLTIGTNGRPTFCEVTQLNGLSSFNDTVCLTVLRHATFEPARNEDGTPVVSTYSTRVTFRLN